MCSEKFLRLILQTCRWSCPTTFQKKNLLLHKYEWAHTHTDIWSWHRMSCASVHTHPNELTIHLFSHKSTAQRKTHFPGKLNRGNTTETLTVVSLSESRSRLQLMQNRGVLPHSECKYNLKNSWDCESTYSMLPQYLLRILSARLVTEQIHRGLKSMFILGLTHQSARDKWLMKSSGVSSEHGAGYATSTDKGNTQINEGKHWQSPSNTFNSLCSMINYCSHSCLSVNTESIQIIWSIML